MSTEERLAEDPFSDSLIRETINHTPGRMAPMVIQQKIILEAQVEQMSCLSHTMAEVDFKLFPEVAGYMVRQLVMLGAEIGPMSHRLLQLIREDAETSEPQEEAAVEPDASNW